MALAAAVLMPAHDGVPSLGVVDFYGLRKTSEEAARRALGLSPGDSLPAGDDEMRAWVLQARRRLEELPGVTECALEFVCCETGRLVLYVGLREQAPPASPGSRPAPSEPIHLADDVVAAGEAVRKARWTAVLKGETGEDGEAGHSLLHDPATRAAQQKYIALAARDHERLRAVLREASNSGERALAAEVLAYSKDKVAAAADLAQAASDPDPGVRNNALRALGVMAGAVSIWPEGRPRIPLSPLLPLLQSLVWTDRNKGSILIEALTRSREREGLVALACGAFEDLAEMARWKSRGHADASLHILGRIAGWAEDAIRAAAESGGREAVIAAAAKARAAASCSRGLSSTGDEDALTSRRP